LAYALFIYTSVIGLTEFFFLTVNNEQCGLDFSLFDIASSRDLPFRQPQYEQYIYYGLIKPNQIDLQ